MQPRILRARRALLLCAGLFAGSALSAAEYFVSTTGVNDAARTGAADQPFATITYALTRATQPGDIVTVQAGTYRGGEAKFQASGVAGNPITLRGAPGATVTLKGSIEIAPSSWSLHSGSIYKAPWTYNFGSYDSRFLDDDPNNDPTYRGNKRRNQFFANGQILEEVGRIDWLKAGSFYVDPVADLVYVWLADGADPATRVMEGSNRQAPLVATWGKSHLVIRNLRLTHLANHVSGDAALRISAPYGGSTGPDSSYVTVEDVSVTWTHGSGISVQGPYHVVRDSEFNDNGHNGLHVSNANYGLFQNVKNLRNNTHPGKTFDVGWEASMKVAGGTKYAVFDGLESAYNIGQGFWIDGPSCQFNTLKNSRIHHNTNEGVRIEICYTSDVFNNLVYENGSVGININASIGSRVFNNTIVRNHDAAVFVGDSRTWSEGWQMTSYSTVVLNNVVVDNQKGYNKKSWNVTKTPADVSGNLPPNYDPPPSVPYAHNISDHNVFVLTGTHPYAGTNPAFFTEGGATNSFATYQTNSGLDANSIYADPSFLDQAGGDYRLRADSIVRGLGSSAVLPLVATDLAGLPRESGFIDPGAYQLPRTAGWLSVASEADTYVVSGTTTNYGTATTLLVEAKGGPTYRKAYLRFPAGSLASEAALELTTENWGTTEVVPFRLYGLVNGHAGDTTWADTSLTYANAPANTSGAYFDSGAVLLHSFTIQLAASGTATNQKVIVRSQALTDFVNQDTNGDITLMLVREPSSTAYPYNYNANTRFYSANTTVSGVSGPRLLLRSDVVAPSADSFIREGSSYAGVNYGTLAYADVKYAAPGSQYHRRAYLKLNLAGRVAPDARLQLLVRGTENGVATATPGVLQLYRVADDSWTETGINGNNEPALGALVATLNVTHPGQVLSFDLGAYAQTEIQGDGVLSLAIAQPSAPTPRIVTLHTREAAHPASKPVLVAE